MVLNRVKSAFGLCASAESFLTHQKVIIVYPPPPRWPSAAFPVSGSSSYYNRCCGWHIGLFSGTLHRRNVDVTLAHRFAVVSRLTEVYSFPFTFRFTTVLVTEAAGIYSLL